jgi:urocanate hydratase
LKLSNIVYAGAGYVLGARAGYERYEQIVRLARRVAGSQTVQSTAGVVQAQFDQFAASARQAFVGRLTGGSSSRETSGVNGYQHRG